MIIHSDSTQEYLELSLVKHFYKINIYNNFFTWLVFGDCKSDGDNDNKSNEYCVERQLY